MEPTRTIITNSEVETAGPLPPGGLADPGQSWVDRVTWGFLVLGVLLRVARYATCQPLWGDEAYLSASLIDRGFWELLKPLDYHQVAPPLFLWAELAFVRLLGFNEWSLRLFPLICGVAGLWLFQAFSAQVTQGKSRLLAVAILAVSFYPIRFASEVKPYATDLAVAAGLLLLAARWYRRPEHTRWVWGLAAFAPVALGLSHPAVFVAGGIVAWVGYMLWRQRSAAAWAAWAGFVVSVCASFGVLYLLVTGEQAESAGAGTWAYWSSAFPPWDRPLAIPLWLVQVHSSHMFAYPVGEARGGSTATTLLCMAGLIAIWRRGPRAFLGLLLAPFLLGLVAAGLGRYPYGGSTRTMQYVAPAICLLAGLGAARLLGRLPGAVLERRGIKLAMVLLSVLGLGIAGLDVALPYKFLEDVKSREFARWFWRSQAEGAELACVKRDLGRELVPIHWETGRTAVYRCNQAIQGGASRAPGTISWERVGPGHPLRCVLYNFEPSDPAVRGWLREMQRPFELVKTRHYRPIPAREVGGLKYEDQYLVFEFVPRSAGFLAAFLRDGKSAPALR